MLVELPTTRMHLCREHNGKEIYFEGEVWQDQCPACAQGEAEVERLKDELSTEESNHGDTLAELEQAKEARDSLKSKVEDFLEELQDEALGWQNKPMSDIAEHLKNLLEEA